MVPKYPYLNFEPCENNAWADCQRFFSNQQPEVLQACDEIFVLADQAVSNLNEFTNQYELNDLSDHEQSKQFYVRAQRVKESLVHVPSLGSYLISSNQTLKQWLQDKKKIDCFDQIILSELVIFVGKALSYQPLCDWYLSFGNALELFDGAEFSKLNVQLAVGLNTLCYFFSQYEDIYNLGIGEIDK